MSALALLQGHPSVEGALAPFNTIGPKEIDLAVSCLRSPPLSGFLGGKIDGGRFVRLLEQDWQSTFKTPYAVAVNSATSGIMVACMALGIKPGDEVIVSPTTMSATAAVPAFLGAKIVYADIEPETFCIDPSQVVALITDKTKAVIATNLFGHPAKLKELFNICSTKDIFLIEDNAQAPFAMEDGHYTGTIGDIGVFSLNIHKHIQAGEGGVCVTDRLWLSNAMKRAMNHGELFEGGKIGLNLRMTELTAAVAVVQLLRGPDIVGDRIDIADALTAEVSDIKWLKPPVQRDGCRHVYYTWPFTIDESLVGFTPRWLCKALNAEGFPVSRGYVTPLHKMPVDGLRNNDAKCPVAEAAHQNLLMYENCTYSPTMKQIQQIGGAFRKIDKYSKRRT